MIAAHEVSGISKQITKRYSAEMPDEKDSSGIFRYTLGIQYRGTNFGGWQRQEQRNETIDPQTVFTTSIQTWLETALSRVADEAITVICAGRTDAGVHAREQVIHFETHARRPLKAWILGSNAHLPDDISVLWGKQVDGNFHARFSATARTYRYVINNSFFKPALSRDFMTWEREPLDVAAMHAAAQALLGENDFSSFRGNSCQSKTPWRNIHHITALRMGEIVVIGIKANAFLHHMVRNIVGAMMQVGRGEKPVNWLGELLAAKDRRAAGMMAYANGLFLAKVDYPPSYDLPQLSLPPLQSGGGLEGLFGGEFC